MEDVCISDLACGLLRMRVAQMIHECRCEAFENETRRSFSHVRPTQASYPQPRRLNEKGSDGRESRMRSQRIHE